MGVKERQDEPDKSGDLRSKKRLYRKVVWQQDIDGGNKEAKKQKGVSVRDSINSVMVVAVFGSQYFPVRMFTSSPSCSLVVVLFFSADHGSQFRRLPVMGLVLGRETAHAT